MEAKQKIITLNKKYSKPVNVRYQTNVPLF